MRYNDWDVLLFPAGQASRYSKTPFKEFGVGCQVIPDNEQAHCHGSVGLPIVTCFVPSIQPGAAFQVSVHSWSEPEITQFTKSYSKHVDLVHFEARVFIDGRLVSSSVFNRKNKEWPHIIDTTLELSKSGELALLKFPSFKTELLSQSDWAPGDDTGRIKVVISEGFPRDSLTMPLERVKNVVAFSFQHAPLDILEARGIAWPNPSMWRVPTLSSISQSTTKFYPDDGVQSHAHSPRHQSMAQKSRPFSGYQGFASGSSTSQPSLKAFPSHSGFGFPPGLPSLAGAATGGMDMSVDPLSGMGYYDDYAMLSAPFPNALPGGSMWLAPGLGGHGASNIHGGTLQSDYAPREGTSASFSGEPMHISGPSLEDDEPLPVIDGHTKAPTNTPTAGTSQDPLSSMSLDPVNSFVTPDFAHSLTHSLLNQPLPIQPQNIPLPASDIIPRKERDSRFLTFHGLKPATALPTPHRGQAEIRKFSQPLFNPASDIFGSMTASTSPASAALSSVTTSCDPSNTDFACSASATAGTVGTPVALANSSATSLNAGGKLKRNRNLPLVSTKGTDDEEHPPRPSPGTRANYSMVDDESDQ